MAQGQPLDRALSPEMPAALWMVNITEEKNPIPNLVVSPEFSIPGIRHRLRLGDIAAR